MFWEIERYGQEMVGKFRLCMGKEWAIITLQYEVLSHMIITFMEFDFTEYMCLTDAIP